MVVLGRGEAGGDGAKGGDGEVDGAPVAEEEGDGVDGMIPRLRMIIRDTERRSRGGLGFGLVRRRGARRHMLWGGGADRDRDQDGDRIEQKARDLVLLGRHFHPLLLRRRALGLGDRGGGRVYRVGSSYFGIGLCTVRYIKGEFMGCPLCASKIRRYENDLSCTFAF